MPKTQEILNTLTYIANNYSVFAIVWHIVLYFFIISLFTKWAPSIKTLNILLCLPILSVAIFAWISGNPFNGMLFSILTILLLFFGLRTPTEPASYSQALFIVAGVIVIAFSLVYPHFINVESFVKYLYASPVGLIPCPTLSLLIGFALIYNGLSSQSITITLIAFGLFYSVFGVLKLAVYLDLFLLFGTLTLLIKYILSIRNPMI
jgi:hypothetical protein